MQEALVVRRETHIPAPPAAVFALLTDPEKILRWMGTEARGRAAARRALSRQRHRRAPARAAPSARWCRCTGWPTASAGTAARRCRRGRA